MHYADTFGSLVLMFPRESLKITSDHLARVSAVRIPGDHGVGAVVSRLLISMREVFRAGELFAPSMFEDAVLDLVCAAATQNTESGIAPPQSVIVAGAKSFIEAHLAEPTLNTTEIAAAQHISVRYLQKLFAADGLTVAGWIRSRRLERSRRDLQDARLVREDISTIGARHGLVKPAHFSRVFREAYGVSPRAFREQFHSELVVVSPGPVGRTSREQPVLKR
jgi:AraC-like DNA-binding protein